MSSSIEALGGLVDAGLVAKSLDGPPAGRGDINAAEIADAHHQCANCGESLAGHYCANCGQQAHVHRSLLHVGEEFLHGITHIEGKDWTTLPMLIARPGRLTRDYIMGRRARYIAPVPLFLMVVFLMFFVFSFASIKVNPSSDGAAMTQAEASEKLAETRAAIKEIDADIAKARAAGNTGEVKALTAGRNIATRAMPALERRSRGEVESPLDIPGEIKREISAAAEKGEVNVVMGADSLNIKAKNALKNPDLVLYKLQSKAYKLSFLLVPLSLPWLWLVFFWHRNVRMYDHAIFALYSISFMSLLFIIGSLALTLDMTAGWFWALLFLAPVAHIFVHLKGTYALSNFGAGWRTFYLANAAVITLSLYGTVMIILGVLD